MCSSVTRWRLGEAAGARTQKRASLSISSDLTGKSASRKFTTSANLLGNAAEICCGSRCRSVLGPRRLLMRTLAHGSTGETYGHGRRLVEPQHNPGQVSKQASKFMSMKIIHSENLGNGANLASSRRDMMMLFFLPALGGFRGDFFEGGIPTLKMREHCVGLFCMKKKKVRSEL
ncbi:hypothetical protein Cgig2_017736 [Carnegiea gigantea]|uniref:Uncharacterized protein n=1 Tax=Carnegiea gigantea TaxID=171969 RepID=A0A9Q1JM31_9CARY|nr:hypothetical protein Cgig2_017736 [Carnegiea gigantea]